MNSRPNIVITGVGVACPIGIGREPFWESLCAKRSGVEQLSTFADADVPFRIGAPVNDFEPKRYVKPRKSLKVMSREIQLGYSAATLAMQDAALTTDQVDPNRIGVVYGSEMLYCDPTELVRVCQRCISDGKFDFSKWGSAAISELYPLWMLLYLPNMTACHVGISQDARGPNNTICLGDASGFLAVIEAASAIERGRVDAMIAGGSSSRLGLTPLTYRGDVDISHRFDAPEAASRPFDAERDGLVNGEGAGAIVLESEQHAQARGAKVLARLTGWGNTFGRTDQPQMHQEAIERSICQALQRASLQPSAIGHISASAAGLVDEDPIEARAIQQQMGDVPVTAPKSFFGHLGASSSIVELVASLLALVHGEVPPILNFESADPRCPVQVIQGSAMPVQQSSALALSQSTTGQTVALVVQRD